METWPGLSQASPSSARPLSVHSALAKSHPPCEFVVAEAGAATPGNCLSLPARAFSAGAGQVEGVGGEAAWVGSLGNDAKEPGMKEERELGLGGFETAVLPTTLWGKRRERRRFALTRPIRASCAELRRSTRLSDTGTRSTWVRAWVAASPRGCGGG